MGDVQQTVHTARTTGHHIESWARNAMSTTFGKKKKTNDMGPFQGIFAAGGIVLTTDWPESPGRGLSRLVEV